MSIPTHAAGAPDDFAAMSTAQRLRHNWQVSARRWPSEIVTGLQAIHDRYPLWDTTYHREGTRGFPGSTGPVVPPHGCTARLLQPPYGYAPVLVARNPQELMEAVATEDKVRAARGDGGARRRIMAWALVRDAEGAVLAVDYGAAGGWALPGGEVPLDEAAPEACRRIVGDMLRAPRVIVARLAAVDWWPRASEEPETHHMVFDVWCEPGEVPQDDSAVQWLPTDQLEAHFAGPVLARVVMAMDARQNARTPYLTGGSPKLPLAG